MKGSISVLKSMVSELTDESNVARGFSVLPVAWSLGCMMGPLIGGVLSRPQDRWPDLFSHPFWASYPYFLPCLAAAALSCLSFITAALFLKETMNTPPMKLQFAKVTSNGSREGPNDTLDEEPSNPKKLLPLRSVLIRPVVISIANYAMLALVNMAATALIPLVWSTSVEFGGLGLRPGSIGLWMSSYGFFNGAFQFAFFPLMARRFGPQRVFVTSVAVCAIIYTMFPLENLAAGGGSKATVWLLMFLQLLSLSISETGFSSIFLFISSAAPSKGSLGTTMGLDQTVVSVQRAVGPPKPSLHWLFAFSITNNVLG
ncbi:major facilitator superfamily domain-containing protein, partial [Multifurca ochricompacta]